MNEGNVENYNTGRNFVQILQLEKNTAILQTASCDIEVVKK